MGTQEEYIKGLQANRQNTLAYYNRSLESKTEQQKLLEKLLEAHPGPFKNVADVACGGGSLSYHLSRRYPNAQFMLIDYNDDALELSRKNNPGKNFQFVKDTIYELSTQADDSFDLVCCWQTLSWLDDAATALKQLVRITAPGGRIFASSLFNLDKDVDLYTRVYDHNQASGRQGLSFNYNTYSKLTVAKWLEGSVKDFNIIPFHPDVDFYYEGRGIGTYTARAESGRRLQISAGMLMNWGILEAIK